MKRVVLGGISGRRIPRRQIPQPAVVDADGAVPNVRSGFARAQFHADVYGLLVRAGEDLHGFNCWVGSEHHANLQRAAVGLPREVVCQPVLILLQGGEGVAALRTLAIATLAEAFSHSPCHGSSTGPRW